MAGERALDEDRIVQGADVLVGKPVIKGTRIPVALVLAKLAANPDLDALFADYPRLTVDDRKACLAYARAAVERQPKAHQRTVPPTSHEE